MNNNNLTKKSSIQDKFTSEIKDFSVFMLEQQYRLTLDFINDAISVIDTDLKLILVNQTYIEWHNRLGFSSDVIGKNLRDLYPFLAENIFEEYQYVIKAGKMLVTEETTTIGTHKFVTETRKIPVLTNGRTNRIITVMHDITKKVNIDKALRESEKKYRELYEYAPYAYLNINAKDGSIINFNNAALQMLGYDNASLLELTLSDLFPEKSKDDHRAKDIFKQVLEGQSFRDEELQMVRKDGRYIWVSLAIDPVCDDKGEVCEGRLCIVEVTNRLSVEKELIEAKRELEKRIVERTIELSEANKSLQKEITERKKYEQKLRALSSELLLVEERERRKIAIDLHDRIGQNLAISKIRLAQLKRQLEISDLQKQTESILELIDQTIQDTRSLTFEISPTVLYELGLEAGIEWMVETMKKQYDIPIFFKCDGDRQNMNESFRFLFFRSTRELMVNAIKHSRAKMIKVMMERTPDRLTIIVEDDGRGFHPTQIDFTGNKIAGFGLFNIYERLNNIGGKLEFSSTAGKGSRFVLTAPLS